MLRWPAGSSTLPYLLTMLLQLSYSTCLAALLALMPPSSLHAQESPHPLELTIDGTTTPILLDTPTTVMIEGKAHQITLRARPEERFSTDGLSFHYPSHFRMTRDTTQGITLWTFSASRCVITLAQHPGYMPGQTLIDALIDDLSGRAGRDALTITPTTLGEGDRRVRGTRIVWTLAGVTLNTSVFPLGEPDATRFLLIVQDTPQSTGVASDETRQALSLLATTLQLAPLNRATP